MQRPVSDGRVQVAARLSTAGLLAGLFLLPALTGCPGSLGAGNWPTASGSGGSGVSGTGGNTQTGTGGMQAMGTGGSTGCPTDMPALVVQTCGGASCHDSGPGAVWGDFVSPGLASRLIGKPAGPLSTGCNGQTMLVNPTKPAAGVLFERLTTNTCGNPPDKMPLTAVPPNPAPPANFVDCLKAWLDPQLQ